MAISTTDVYCIIYAITHVNQWALREGHSSQPFADKLRALNRRTGNAPQGIQMSYWTPLQYCGTSPQVRTLVEEMRPTVQRTSFFYSRQ